MAYFFGLKQWKTKDFKTALLFIVTVLRHIVSMIHMQPSGASGVLGAFWDAGIPTSLYEFTRNP